MKHLAFMQKIRNGSVRNAAEFEQMENEVFFKEPQDFLLKMAVATSIPDIFKNPTQFEYTLQAPYVNVFLGDYMYLGFCLEVNLESIRQHKISKGQIDKQRIDNSFDAVFWLKGSNNENGGILVEFIAPNEIGIITSTNRIFRVKDNEQKKVQVDFSLEKKISNCNETVTEMTPCIQKRLNRSYDNSYLGTFEKSRDLAMNRMKGLNKLSKESGCDIPCLNTWYLPREFITFHTSQVRDESLKVLEEHNEVNGSILVVSHVEQERYEMKTEMHAYSLYQFICDIGGISGVFLGISFWTFYQSILAPILKQKWFS